MQITVPSEFQGNVIGDINRRKGVIQSSEQEGDDVIINVRERVRGPRSVQRCRRCRRCRPACVLTGCIAANSPAALLPDHHASQAHVPLNEMFGYSTGLRSMTQVGGWVRRGGCLPEAVIAGLLCW